MTYYVMVPKWDGWYTDTTTTKKRRAKDRAYELRLRGARIIDSYGEPVSP